MYRYRRFTCRIRMDKIYGMYRDQTFTCWIRMTIWMRTSPLWRTYGVPAISIWTSFVSSCPFLVGIMLSPRFRFLTCLAYNMYLDTYVRWSHHFYFCLRYTICFSHCEYYLLFYLLPSWGNLPLQSYWSLSCDHGLHCSDELMWEQQRAFIW